MRNEREFNGWTNYETWRVNLEYFDGRDLRDNYRNAPDASDLRDELREEFLDYLETDCNNKLTLDYARCFAEEVNFLKIAEHLIDAAEFQTEEEKEDMDDDETRVQNEVNA